MRFKRVLALAPHADDVELCAGGTIARLIEAGCSVAYRAFAYGDSMKLECIESMKVLGVEDYEIFSFKPLHFPKQRQEIQQFLYDYNQERSPDLVLTPSRDDIHQDHQVLTLEALRAFKNSTILGYIQPWNHIAVYENCFIEIEERHLKKKIEALWKYDSQFERGRKYFNKRYLESLAIASGMRIGCEYAEVFEVIKLIYGG